MIKFDSDICRNLPMALGREWLETNGIGGFSSSTITGLNSRRYHGLLIAALQPPISRYSLLSKIEETLVIDGRRYELSANQYPNSVHPQGFQFLLEFRLDPFPIFTYKVEDIEIEKSIFMIYGENSTVIQYRIKSEGENSESGAVAHTKIQLELRPLIAFRDFHSTTHENNTINGQVNIENQLALMTPYQGLPTIYFAHNAHTVDQTGHWYRNFEYEQEQQRGLDLTEDLFQPFVMIFDLSTPKEVSVIASTKRHDIARVDIFRRAEIKRRGEVVAAAPHQEELIRQLIAAADKFIVKRGDQKTVLAGYPWFGDWGRDTMIALPGLTLTTGRFDTAKSILLAYAYNVDQGMIPNSFPDDGRKPEYNSVDATLWFFEAVRSFLKYTQDYKFIKANLYNVLTDIIAWHEHGTRYNIHVDYDGLLASGQEGVALTWMDAKVGDWVVTSRRGKPVEIQALWYNALCIMQDLAEIFGDNQSHDHYKIMAAKALTSFNQQFWNEDQQCLYDVVDGHHKDASLRPNQILAVSLTHTMLSRERSLKVVETVERELLTPYGLRTLSSKDPNYKRRYEGDTWSRDGAYHQGTVWAWLMGPFITAYLKVNSRSSKAVDSAKLLLSGFHHHMMESGVGQISEIFDGDSPHNPQGCIAQAFSVAEVLRAMVEDVFVEESNLVKHHRHAASFLK